MLRVRAWQKKTYVNPGTTGYCTGITFRCPTAIGTQPLPQMPEMVGFIKENVGGFEIYSLPVYDKFGLNFSIKDKKLIFTFVKESLVPFLEALSDPTQKKLKDSDLFSTQFNEVPAEISTITYVYPYSLIGLTKYVISFAFDNFGSSLLGYVMPSTQTKNASYREIVLNTVFEFLDKGVAPYLKVLKVESAYSYSLEKGLMANKGRLVIKELSSQEKEDTEAFLDNIESWIQQKIILLTPSLP